MIRVSTFFGQFIRRTALAGLLALATSALVAQAQVLSTPKNISNNAGSSGLPRIAVDSRGNINVVWVDDTPGNSDIFFSRSADGGATFSTPKNLSNSPDQSYFPLIAVDSSGNINVVWHDVVVLLGNAQVLFFFSRSTDGGATFSTSKNLAAFTSGEQIAVDSSGNINLVWVGFAFGSSASSDILFSRSTDGGATFSAPKNLSNNIGFCAPCAQAPQISVDPGGNINVVWPNAGVNGSNVGIFFSRSTDGGATFSTPKKISNSTVRQISSTQIAVDLSGNINVIWEEDSGNFNIIFTRSTDGGATFSPPKNLSNNTGFSTGFSFDAEIAVDSSGNINVVWEDTNPGFADVFFSRSSDGGGTFSAPKNLSNNNTGALLRPQIAVDSSGNINVVWEGAPLGQYDIFLSRSTDGGATFSLPKNLSNNTGWSLEPRIALDSLGDINVVWEDNTPGQYDIFVGTVAGGPLKPTGLNAVVGKGSVYLRWNPFPVKINTFVIDIKEESGNTLIPHGTIFCDPHNFIKVGTILQQDASCLITKLPDGTPIMDGITYRFAVSAKSGVDIGVSSDPVRAASGQFSDVNKPPRPTHRLLFLHGFHGDGRVDGTFRETLRFMSQTLGWTYGGQLYHTGDDLETAGVDKTGSCEPDLFELSVFIGIRLSNENCNSDIMVDKTGDFFTASFGSRTADYSDRRGLSHQGDEVSSFVAKMTADGVPLPFTIIAHSNGGLAARDFITRFQGSTSRIFEVITYGTPHRGADLSDHDLLLLRTVYFPPYELDGARNARFTCTSPTTVFYPAPFLQDLSEKRLPDGIRYTAITGSSDVPLSLLFGVIPLRSAHRNPDCHSADWDTVVPVSSADLTQVGEPVRGIQVRSLSTNHEHMGQGNDFPTILCAIDPNCAMFRVMSPVDVEVTAPDGRTMARDFSAIPGASYMNIVEEDGHETATVLIPFPQGGQYTIKAIPKPGALPTDTFTITLTQNGTTTVLAQDEQIRNIPTSGFHMHVNSRPIAIAGPDQTIECRGPNGTPVNLNGSASGDQDGDPLTFVWTDSQGHVVGNTAMVNVSAPMGTQTYTLTVTDPSGLSATSQTHVTVRDTTPPILRVTLSPNVLWPPNHKLVPIFATLQVTDTCDPNPAVVLVSITSNEPLASGDIRGAVFGTNSRSFLLAADRLGTGTGRVYTVTYRATDHSGNSTTSSVTVTVPHDQGKH